jgi:hypothetical protein
MQHIDPIKISPQSKATDLITSGLYELILDFCQEMWPMNRFYGVGIAIPGGIYLPANGSARLQAYVEYDGLRYGSYFHSSGKGACYGYIEHRHPVRIERIVLIEVPNHPRMRTICVLVRRFKLPAREPDFPWSAWYLSTIFIDWIFLLAYGFCTAGKFILALHAGDITTWISWSLSPQPSFLASLHLEILSCLTVAIGLQYHWTTLSLSAMEKVTKGMVSLSSFADTQASFFFRTMDQTEIEQTTDETGSYIVHRNSISTSHRLGKSKSKTSD